MSVTRTLVICLVYLLPLSRQQDFAELAKLHVGCFRDDLESRDLERRMSGDLNTIDKCIGACRDNYYKYAGLQNGRVCYCGSQYGNFGDGECNVPCEGNTNQICGGLESNTVYKTGAKAAGPPENLRQSSEPTNSSIFITWDPPRSGSTFEYVVKVSLHFSYNPDQARFTDKMLRLTSNTTATAVLGLLPGSQFNVTMYTEGEDTVGPAVTQLFWTEVGVPKVPESPTVVKSEMDRKSGVITVTLSPVEEYYGPITSYRVIVIDETTPTIFDTSMLYDYVEAEKLGLNYWIAAELDPDFLLSGQQFKIGDNTTYHGYVNQGPLLKNEYRIVLSAVSQLNGITKASYAKVSHRQNVGDEEVVFDFPAGGEGELNDPEQSEAGDSTALVVCVVIACIVLIAALAFFLFVRKNLGHKLRGRQYDTQELTNHPPSSTETIENGYVDNNGYVEDGAHFKTREDYLQYLEGKVWQIPRNFVDIQNEVLGRGKFGTVMNGTVNIKGDQVNCNIYSVPNQMIDDDDRKVMLKDLDLNVKAKHHDNIVNLIGVCEELDTTLFILDAVEVELKQFLLDSRSLQHQPGYANKSERFSSMREDAALEIMMGVAKGLGHLVLSGVLVKELCSRTIYICGGWKPKIFGFGIAEYNKRTVSLDFTRWKAPETLLKNQYSSKSLAWSYGCVLWEIVSIGGTPYPELRTSEVKARILQGLRLPQTQYVSDQLYQLMLTCWMTDPSERPDFNTIIDNLASMLDEQMMLSFEMPHDFKYERYLPELEHISSS